ncbi:hypothetical protein A2U01_0085587, partial [Trifolium medium]|nr:hypothetical protein [Trifolium medium]
SSSFHGRVHGLFLRKKKEVEDNDVATRHWLPPV